MTDQRPRPEYGEYATPEEQAEAIGTVPEAMQDITPQAIVDVPAATPAAALPVQRRWDLVLTIVLVAVGTYVTFSSLSVYADLGGFMQEVYATYGYTGTLADPSLASAVGIALNIVQPVLLVLAVVLAARSLRAGRVTFWIPLAAGVLAFVIWFVLVVVIFVSDPGLMNYLQTMGQ